MKKKEFDQFEEFDESEGFEVVAPECVPVTEAEAFEYLDNHVPLEVRREAVQMTGDEFASDQHFGLGMWIRNNWIYGADTDDPDVKQRYRQCRAMLAGGKADDELMMLVFNADMASSDFLERYHDHLMSFVAFDAPVISVRRKPVKCRHCGGKVAPVVYGEPGPEMMEAADRGEVVLGGCCIRADGPDYQCPVCGQRYAKDR